MANGRKLLREYAQSKGKEAVSFVKIKDGGYGCDYDTLVTKNGIGHEEYSILNYKSLFHWIVKNKKIT